MSIAHQVGMIAAAAGVPIRTVARTYSAFSLFVVDPVTAQVTLSHLRNGDLSVAFVQNIGESGTPNADEWNALNPIADIGDSWEFRYLVTAGDTLNVGGLTDGTWYQINATRDIGNAVIAASSAIVRSSTLTLEYRPFSGGPTLYTVTGLVITAEVSV